MGFGNKQYVNVKQFRAILRAKIEKVEAAGKFLYSHPGADYFYVTAPPTGAVTMSSIYSEDEVPDYGLEAAVTACVEAGF